MGTLKLDMQTRWKDGLLVVIVFAIVMFIASSCSIKQQPAPPPPDAHPTHWAVGGPGWRVMDVKETTDSTDLAFIQDVAKEVSECIGIDIDLEGWRFFGFNVLMYQKVHLGGAWEWRQAHGVARPVEKWLYVQGRNRLRSQDSVIGTLRHELVHVGTMQDSLANPHHPDVDALIGKCAGQHKGQERYLRVYLRSQP